MKNRILLITVLVLTIISCNQKSKQEELPKTKVAAQSGFSTDLIVKNYLSIKNALVNDDSDASASAGKLLSEAMTKTAMEKVSADQMKTYMDIADNIKEQAEHIGNNDGNISLQREHFVLLSKDINDLIQNFGTEQKLYQDFCPMADEGKGAIWISESKDIKNPYFGSEMLTCGSVRKEFQNEKIFKKIFSLD